MKFFYSTYKLLLIFISFSVYLLVSAVFFIFLVPFPFKRRRVALNLNVLLAKFIVTALNFDIKQTGPLPKEGSIVIGNHMSYLDTLIYLSRFKCLFVTSVDMGRRPFLGQITWLSGCLFVERRNPRHLHKELKTIKKYFDNGFMVCFFPEGTSSDGRQVLPFKKSLFQLGLETLAPIQPIVLTYKSIDGVKFGDSNRDKVCWYGDLSFYKHFMTLMTLKEVKIELQALSPILSSDFKNRKELSDISHKAISEQYQHNLGI